MDTVSYLTINDETKEIADKASRNSIENIAATIAAHSDDIEYIQLETGPQGSLSNSINQAYSTAFAAQGNASAAAEAAALADEKAGEAGEAATSAQLSADDAATAAQNAWNRAGDAAIAASVADQKAESATAAAAVAWTQAGNAASAAEAAQVQANLATESADLANHKADLASVAASDAQLSADRANNYANGALSGLSTLESVVDTVNWFAAHRTPTEDTTVDPSKNYYSYDSSTGTMSKVEAWGDENPALEGWYELDETIQNYVASHVAETDDGLYVLSIASGWRVLISTGGGNYTPGVFIVDPYGVIKQAMTGDGINFDSTSPFTIGDENAYIVFDGRGHITLGGDGVNILSSVSIGENSKTLSEVLNDLGKAITTIEYGVGISNTSHSDIEEWSTESPIWQPDKYVWMRTSNNGLTYTYTCIQGAQGPRGETGATGEKGEAGPEGIGILSIEIFYALSDSEEIMPEDDAWKTSLNNWYAPQYGEGITGETGFIGETGETGYYIEVIGETGETGETGTTSDTFNEEDLLYLQKGTWLWVKTETTYTDFTSSATYQKSYIGTDGQDGKSIFIQSASKENGVTTVTLVDSDGNEETLTINDGEDGTNGMPGAAGYVHIAWATSSDGSQGFSTTVSENKTYMGVYTDNAEIDSEIYSDYSWSLIKGADGTSVSIDNIKYAVNSNGLAQPSDSNFETEMPTVNKGQWLWVKTTYTDGNVTVTKSYIGTDGQDGKSVSIGSVNKENGVTTIVLTDNEGHDETLEIIDGQDGNDGTPGTNGLNGYIHTAWATSADGSQGFSTSVSTGKTYLGVYTDNTQTDSQQYSDYSWSLIKGEKGDPGESVYLYELLCNPSAIAKATPSAASPAITFTAKRAEGTTPLTDYAGRFIIATSEDGSSWVNKYTSSSNETSTTYTPPANIKFVRCQLYLAGGTSTLVDTQTVPIISDGKDGTDGEDGKILNIHSGVYLESQLPSISSVDDGDAYLVNDGDKQYDLYYKGTKATTWTIVEDWQGVEGPTGETGARGETGATGNGISSVTEQYARNNSSSSAPTTGWSTTVLNPTSSERFVWNREIMNYTDGTSADPTTPHVAAIFGEQGADGKGIASIIEYYAINNSSDTAPIDDDFSTTIKSPTITDRFLWNYEVIAYTSGNPTITEKHVIGVYGQTGATGATGKTGASGADGKDAYTIILTNESHNFPAGVSAALATSTTCNIIAYKGTTQVSASIGTITGQVTGLTTSIANNNSTSANFTVSAATTLTTRSGTLTIPIVVDGKSFTKKFTWALSNKGEPGTSVTVTSNEIKYIKSTSGTEAPSSTANWQDTIPTVEEGSFLWTRTKTTFSDSTSATSYTVSRQAVNGTNGTSVTVSNTEYGYQLSTNGTTPPTGEWKTSPQAPTTTQYAWTRTTTTYSDGSEAIIYTVGGKTGTNGTNSYTHIRYATDSAGSGMTATPTASTTYIGIYTGTSSTAPTAVSSYKWSKYVGDKGEKGDKGDPGQNGAAGPEAVVTITPTNVNWAANTATLSAILRVNGVITTPTAYNWTKGSAATSLGTAATLTVDDLNSTYNCTVTW